MARRSFEGPTLLNAVVASVVAAFIMASPVAVPAAFAGRRSFRIALLVPMLVPSIVLAIGYDVVFSRIGLNQTYLGVILAHTGISVPVMLLGVILVLLVILRPDRRAGPAGTIGNRDAFLA